MEDATPAQKLLVKQFAASMSGKSVMTEETKREIKITIKQNETW